MYDLSVRPERYAMNAVEAKPPAKLSKEITVTRFKRFGSDVAKK